MLDIVSKNPLHTVRVLKYGIGSRKVFSEIPEVEGLGKDVVVGEIL